MICPKCGKELKDNAKFCSGCGEKISVETSSAADVRYCRKCGSEMTSENVFCPKCGHDQQSVPVTAVPVRVKPAAAPAQIPTPVAAAPQYAQPDPTPAEKPAKGALIGVLVICALTLLSPFINLLNCLADTYSRDMRDGFSYVLDKDKSTGYISSLDIMNFYKLRVLDDIDGQIDNKNVVTLISVGMVLVIVLPYVLAVVRFIMAAIGLGKDEPKQMYLLRFWRGVRATSLGVIISNLAGQGFVIGMMVGYEIISEVETLGETIALSPLGIAVQCVLLVMIVLSFIMAGKYKSQLEKNMLK